MRLQADSTDTYGGSVLVGAPAVPQRRRAAFGLTREARPAAGEVLNTQVIPKMIQRVLVDNWEPARALDECHKKIAEIYTRNEKG